MSHIFAIHYLKVNMFSAALFINQALGWNIYFGILFQLALTSLCTALGIHLFCF